MKNWQFTYLSRWPVSRLNSYFYRLDLFHLLYSILYSRPQWRKCWMGRPGLEPGMPKPRIYSPLRYQFRSPTHMSNISHTIIRCLLVVHWISPVGDFLILAKPQLWWLPHKPHLPYLLFLKGWSISSNFPKYLEVDLNHRLLLYEGSTLTKLSYLGIWALLLKITNLSAKFLNNSRTLNVLWILL